MNSLKKNQIEILFKSVVECGKGFKDYNFRNYIVRRAAEDFQKIQTNHNEQAIDSYIQKNQQYLELIKRQQFIQNMYHQRNHILDEK